MNKHLGIVFICISAFLYGIRYISAAIYGSHAQTWSRDLFQSMLEYVGPELLVLSWISLIAGLLILFLSTIKARVKKEIQQVRENWNKDIEDYWDDEQAKK
jgi:hypothetical protein